jgi:hypothetical protein
MGHWLIAHSLFQRMAQNSLTRNAKDNPEMRKYEIAVNTEAMGKYRQARRAECETT